MKSSMLIFLTTAVVSASPTDSAKDVVRASPATAEIIPDSYIVMFKHHVSDLAVSNHYTEVESIHNDIVGEIYKSRKRGNPSNDTVLSGLQHRYNISEEFKGYAGSFYPSLIKRIQMDPNVDTIVRDTAHTVERATAGGVGIRGLVTERGAPWGLARLSHQNALSFRTFNKYIYEGEGGEGVDVYVIGSGCNIKHEEFEGRASWIKTIPEGEPDEDITGHGTHSAGTIAGKRYGVAKKARVLCIKVTRASGTASTSDIIGGINHAVEHHREDVAEKRKRGGYKGSVGELALGGGYSRQLNRAIDSVVRAGITFAVPAGNDNDDACDYSPASASEPLTVGASTISDDRAWFSNHGGCVNIFAPGKDITSAWIGSNRATNTISGTAMASAHIAGLVAYYASLSDTPLSPEELKKKVWGTASSGKLSDIPGITPNFLAYNHADKA